MARRARHSVVVASCALVASGCSASPATDDPAPGRPSAVSTATTEPARTGRVTVALGGDVHFEGNLRRLLRPGATLGPISRTLRAADVAMVNLETPVTSRTRRDPKELERPQDRYHFRTSPRAFDVLAESGVDVVSVANNHAGDYGWAGLADTLEAGADRGVATVGAGRDATEAHAPHVVEAGGLEVAFLAADGVQREGTSGVWEAGPDDPGIATARGRSTTALLAAVEAQAALDRLVVVHLHWGKEYESCPTQSQRLLARDLAGAGADVVVGSHSHVLGGVGWAGETLVGYGLGNLAWYHDRQATTGVLTVTLDAAGVVAKEWTPARISGVDGRPAPVTGPDRARAVADFRSRQRCTGLASERGGAQADDPAYASSVSRIDAALAQRMRRSHRPGCPVPLDDLRHVRVVHRDLDGRARSGELVVHRRWARDVTEVFGRLYAAGWPIARMRLVDDYGADDDLSMAANNSSAFNCRRVAGQESWSLHAYGAAIDLNPVQNPYVRPGRVDPPAGRRFVAVDRARSAPVAPGVVREDDLVVSAFARIGWEWGGDWVSSKDYQHLAAPVPPAGS
ncbi:poly-gamma-glutamate synthesis protein (capsule biosynthesis protein) [Nocardioides cavernae]|uniref:Poly-gamma-glutamate synthesis protein (Capsule biosynthesis protein) n=1 Tax=Nocardioides cavernae TaxID=1921566 RepID=A0A7Y9KRK5_9ACTN|nr:CapA family protein [Nocardioides cavernae]NYE35412.1 poly-gamma-glutamate synthesis protein (capsule biosynthesis protein) [Nocardioides cavernae]